MAIQILNAGASLKIVVGDAARLLSKSNIKSVRVVEGHIKLGVDGCCGAPFDYLPYAQITTPTSTNIEELRDLIGAMLDTPGLAPNASTLDKQNEAIGELQNIKTAIDDAKQELTQSLSHQSTEQTQNFIYQLLFDMLTIMSDNVTIDYEERRLLSPLRTETIGQVTYEGYSDSGMPPSVNGWSIKRTTVNPGAVLVQWADGGRTLFNHSWNQRATYNYL